MLTFSYSPFDQWWLPFLVLPLWLWLNARFTKRSFISAWCFGLGFFGTGIAWVHVSIATFGGVPLIASLMLMFLLCGYLALFPAVFYFLLQRYFVVTLWPLAAPLIWLLMEWVRANALTGFPWLSIGYSQTDSPLHIFYPLIGEIGVSGLMILLASVATVFLYQRSSQSLFTMLSVYLIVWVSSFLLAQHNWLEPTEHVKKVALVQGNIEQNIRWRPEQDLPTMEKYLTLSEHFWHHDLIIWPEAAIPRLEVLAIDFLAQLDALATEYNTSLVTGIVDVNLESGSAYNKLIALGMDTPSHNTQAYRYPNHNYFAKHHLLPIGEFVPFEQLLRPLAPIFDLPMSSFSRGDYIQANLLTKGLHLAPAICFEIAFPGQIAANITDKTDAIITVSNDAWFGDSHGPHQHLQIARVRSMEFGLPLLRATNNGITAAFDHNGDLLGKLPQFEPAVLSVDVNLVNGRTPYLVLGNIPIYGWFIFSTLIAIYFQCKLSTKRNSL